MKLHQIISSQSSLEQLSFSKNERDRSLLAARESLRERYGIDPELPIILGIHNQSQSRQIGQIPFSIPLYSSECDSKTQHSAILGCEGIVPQEDTEVQLRHYHATGSDSSKWEWETPDTFNSKISQLRNGLRQMIEATQPVTPDNPLNLLLLRRKEVGFAIYEQSRDVLLVQNRDRHEGAQHESDWKLFRKRPGSAQGSIKTWAHGGGCARSLDRTGITFEEIQGKGEVVMEIDRSGWSHPMGKGAYYSVRILEGFRGLCPIQIVGADSPLSTGCNLLSTERAILPEYDAQGWIIELLYEPEREGRARERIGLDWDESLPS